MSWIPEEPAADKADRIPGSMALRFEDVTQDGRVVLEALPHALDPVWRALRAKGSREMMRSGILPILSRAILENGEGPVSVMAKTETEGLYHFWHTAGPDGAADRIVLGMWSQLRAPRGHTHGPPPPPGGEPIVAGRVFCEHVLTRPFAPPGERRVTRIEMDGSPWLPPERRAWRSPEAILELPEGATAIDPELSLDPLIVVFGLDHTDSNQHVNSLVYTRLFIEAALRRLASHGRRRALFARAAELAYRKPCFAGEQVRIGVRAFTLGDRDGVVAALYDEREAAAPLAQARPRCFARLLLGE